MQVDPATPSNINDPATPTNTNGPATPTPIISSSPINSDSLVIDLLPQQALYLPPYWFHTVVTVEASLSLNVWSNSDDYLLMEEVLASPIPFEADWSIETY